MKAIQVTIDEDLLKAVDREIQARGENRSAFIRESLEEYLKSLRIRRLEGKDRQGYLKHPEQKGEFDIWHKEQVWDNL